MGADPRLATCVALMLAAGFFQSVKDALRSALIGRGQLVRDVLSLGGERAALFVIGVWTMSTGGGLVQLCVAILMVRIAATAATWMLVRGIIQPIKFRVKPRFVRSIGASGAIIAVAGVCLTLCGQIEVVVIGVLRHMTEAGWYSAAHWSRSALLIVPGVMGAVLVPKLAERHHDDPTGFSSLFGGGVKYACAAGMAITANGLLLSSAAVRWMFGEGYGPAAHTLNILLLGLPAVFGLAFLQGSLLSIDRSRRVFGISVLGMAAQVALGVVLVPRYGANGAAAATVAVETALFIGFYAAVRRRIPGVAHDVFLKAPAAFVAAGMGVWLASGHGLVFQLASANALFALALLFAGFVGVPERRAMLAAFHRGAVEPAAIDSRVRVE
jgi:O-antigen/teichoic acid export membrane protein